jgi:hypothetical protein
LFQVPPHRDYELTYGKERAMQERRKEQRWPSYLGGRAVLADRYPPTYCIIRNTSGGGARLEMRAPDPLPAVFQLRIPNRNAAMWVQTRWHADGEMGVEVVVDRPADVVDAQLSHQWRALDAQTDALKQRLREMSEFPS